MALGWTYIVYRLPQDLRYEDGPTVVEAVRANPPSVEAKVAQWNQFGPTTIETPDVDEPREGHGSLFVRSNYGYPDSDIVRASMVRSRCPELDPDEWVVLDAWDMS